MTPLQWLFVIFLSTTATKPRNFQPPLQRELWNDTSCLQGSVGMDPRFNCHGARFVQSHGFAQPCSRHSHCYSSREPSDWCILPRGQIWTNWGCHCDKKIGSCVIERYDTSRRQLQWAYCSPNSEFYCANKHLLQPRAQ